MKTIFTTLLFAILVVAGLRGVSQCIAPNFTYTINPGGDVGFTDYSYYWDSLSSPPSYVWNFGDGDTVHNSSYGVNHTYATSGTYTVSLEISSNGCDSTISQTLVLNLCAGGAQFNSIQTGFGSDTFFTINLSSLPGATVAWTFGDGGTSTSSITSHSYSASGTYPVTLIVTDAALSCADTLTQNLQVNLCSYPVGIDTVILSYNPVDVQFQPSNINAGYTYNWEFVSPTGSYSSATGASVNHNFLVTGYDSIFLQITDATTGCILNIVNYDYINLCGLNAGFSAGGNGLTQSFFAYNYDSINGSGLNISSYLWTFPGATPSSGSGSEVNNVVYPSVGTYSACLYLTTTTGCLDTICNTISVSPPVYYITGVVAKNGGSGFNGTVYLIVQDSIGHLALLDSVVNVVDSATNGYSYYFGNLPVDTYYVKAALNIADPDYASYLPTYYGDVLTWGTATPIDLTINAASANINLIAGTNTGGPGFVGGYVSQGAGLVLGGSGNNNSKSLGAPLQGVQINLLTSTGSAVAYTYTDVNGYYQFPGLALGSYKIYAEELNKIPTPIDFTLTQQNPTDSGANISINSHSAAGVDNINNVQISDAYPNPVTSSVELSIACSKDVSATLKLVDVLGRITLSQPIKLISGQNTYQVNMETMSAGVYQLEIQTATKQITYKLVKAK